MIRKQLFSITLLALFYLCANAQNWDIDLAKDINPTHPGSGYWKFTSASTYLFSAGVPVGVLAAGFITGDAALKKKSIEVFGAMVTEVIVSEAMKKIFDRQRPAEKYPGIIFPYKDLHGQSFPSGHTSLAFAAAASLSIQCKKWYVTVPAYLWAGSVCYSRIYLGVHYPSDVLAGAAVGIGSAYLVHWANKKLFGEKKHHHQ